MANKAVFIDRDGTINVNTPYVNSPERLVLYPGVASGIRRLNAAGYKVIVITNQSGIARGLFTKETLEEIHNELKLRLKRKGARLDAVYYCPHHPDEKCKCRKPETALLDKAIVDFKVNVASSFIIGDRMLDVEAGYKIGCRSVLVPEKGKEKSVEAEKAASRVKADYECKNFASAVNWILKGSGTDK